MAHAHQTPATIWAQIINTARNEECKSYLINMKYAFKQMALFYSHPELQILTNFSWWMVYKEASFDSRLDQNLANKKIYMH